MKQLQTLLSLECTQISVPCTSKKRALEMISQIAAEHSDLAFEPLFDSLLEREKVGTTAIGNGVAMPHCKISLEHYVTQEDGSEENDNNSEDDNSIEQKPLAVFITTEDPVDFGAADNRPVEVLFALFVPEDQCQEYMPVLSNISNVLNDAAMVKQLRYAESPQELQNILFDAYSKIVQNNDLDVDAITP